MRRNDRKSLKFCLEKREGLSQNTQVKSQNIKGPSRNKEATFFVYSHYKYFLKEIYFDQDLWLNLKNTLFLFYKNFNSKSIFSC